MFLFIFALIFIIFALLLFYYSSYSYHSFDFHSSHNSSLIFIALVISVILILILFFYNFVNKRNETNEIRTNNYKFNDETNINFNIEKNILDKNNLENSIPNKLHIERGFTVTQNNLNSLAPKF